MARPLALAVAVALVCACAASPRQAKRQTPLRSPSYDYPAAGPYTADGEVLGADKQNTTDKLNSGVRAGPGGVQTPDYGATLPTEEEEEEEEEQEEE